MDIVIYCLNVIFMEKELRIKLFSYDQEALDLSIKKIIEIARNNDCDIKGPIPLPTKKVIFTFCRSPHVNKPAMEQFEKRTHKRLIVLENISTPILDNLKRLIIPASVKIKVKL